MATAKAKISMSNAQSGYPIKYIIFRFQSSAITNAESIEMVTMRINSDDYRIMILKGTNTATNTNNNKLKIQKKVDNTYITVTDASVYTLNSQTPTGFFEYKAGAGQWATVGIKFPEKPAAADSYFQINSNPNCSFTLAGFAYYASENNEQKQYYTFNTWGNVDDLQWYAYSNTSPKTWQNVHYSVIDSRAIDSIQTLFNTFTGNDAINPTPPSNITTDTTDTNLLNLAISPEFKIYIDVKKTIITQTPV